MKSQSEILSPLNFSEVAGRKYQIATIPGDGIGKEVVPEGIRVVEAAARRFGFSVSWHEFPHGAAKHISPPDE